MFFFFFDFKPYVAIIGDIVNSKDIKNRNDVQTKLKACIDTINKKYSSDIASKFMITLGDEFQGLLETGKNVMEIIQTIEFEMYPIKMRFGIGAGEITTNIDPEMPLGADGPAYYSAREMINELKNLERKQMKIDSNIRIKTPNNVETDLFINTILSLCTVIKNKWTDRQREIIFDTIRHCDNQQKTADRFGITQSSVQKSLSAAGYYTYKNSMNIISDALEEIRSK